MCDADDGVWECARPQLSSAILVILSPFMCVTPRGRAYSSDNRERPRARGRGRPHRARCARVRPPRSPARARARSFVARRRRASEVSKHCNHSSATPPSWARERSASARHTHRDLPSPIPSSVSPNVLVFPSKSFVTQTSRSTHCSTPSSASAPIARRPSGGSTSMTFVISKTPDASGAPISWPISPTAESGPSGLGGCGRASGGRSRPRGG